MEVPGWNPMKYGGDLLDLSKSDALSSFEHSDSTAVLDTGCSMLELISSHRIQVGGGA